MKKRRRGRPAGKRTKRKARSDVLSLIASARAAGKAALQSLRTEIAAARRLLERLLAEERSFRLDLFGSSGPGRPRGSRRRVGRPPGKKTAGRKPRRKGPPKADSYFTKLPTTFTIEQVRKLAGKATGVSLAQWARAKRVKKTASGYVKIV